MTIEEAIQTIKAYQCWRRGAHVSQPMPGTISKALDKLIEADEEENNGNMNSGEMIYIPRYLLVSLVAIADKECFYGSPNHAHEIPGIWDSDNGDNAGKPCSECAMYDYARKIVAETAEIERSVLS